MNRAEDLRGRKFGKLIVVRRAGSASDGSALWRCRCECGKARLATYRSLRLGRVKACVDCRVVVNGWTAEEEQRLRGLYPTTDTRELAKLFGRTAKAICSRAKILKVAKAIGYHGRVRWTRKMIAIVRRRYPDTPTRDLALELGVSHLALYQRAEKLGVKKTPEHIARTLEECGRQAVEAGRAHRFQKGIVPANKGLRRPGWYRGRMRETQFKKGQPPTNTMPLWSFRWIRCGSGKGRGKGTAYMALKTGKPAPPPMNGWEWVHKMVWEQAHGPIPAGHRIWWKDGDHANNALSNLELLSDRDHMLRTTVHNLPKPLVEVIQLAGALKRKIRAKERKLNGQEHVAGSQGSPVRDAGIAV